MKTIRFKQDWRYSRKGDVIEEGDGVADLLIQRHIVEEVDVEDNQAEETSETTPAEDTGMGSALPTILTRQVPGPTTTPGPNTSPRRRGGRG